MSTHEKKITLPQPAPVDHAAKILRDKIGDILSLGDTPAAKPAIRESAPDQKSLEEKIIAALRTIYDPEIPLNVYDLGLIYKISLDAANSVRVEMTLTAPGCPVAGDIVANVKRVIEGIPEIPKADVELVWDPPWTRERLSEAARLELGLM